MTRRRTDEEIARASLEQRDLPSTADAADWRQNTLAAVASSQEGAKVVRTGRRRAQALLQFDVEFSRMLTEAARSRGISVAGYGRRALARQIAKDLGIDWAEALVYCPEPTPFGARQARRRERTTDTGEGFGDWNN